MIFHHIAAIALVGWYLMIPPMSASGVDISAPLSRWTVYKNYDSIHLCVAGETQLRERGDREPNMTPPLQFPPRQLEQFASADCIASDDPRLKEK
jgi:hypothetical protein